MHVATGGCTYAAAPMPAAPPSNAIGAFPASAFVIHSLAGPMPSPRLAPVSMPGPSTSLAEPAPLPRSSVARCGVCGSAHHGTHFGILSCRACASFFRRTITERKRYKCRRNNNCDILKSYYLRCGSKVADGMRNACRACRLQRCLRAGMNWSVEPSDEPAPISAAAVASSSPASHSSSGTSLDSIGACTKRITFEITDESPLLDKFIGGLHNFVSGQRSIFTMEHPHCIFSNVQYRIESQTEFVRMERGSITLLSTLIANQFPGVCALTRDQRLELLKRFSPLFFYLLRSYLTTKTFPDGGESLRIATHAGCYVDHCTFHDHFFRDLPDREEHIRFTDEMMARASQMMSRYKSLAITEREVVALGLHFLVQCAVSCNLAIAQLNEMRDCMLMELHADCLRRFGHEAPLRLGQLFAFAEEILMSVNDIKESIAVAKIFLTNIPDVWEECDDIAACI